MTQRPNQFVGAMTKSCIIEAQTLICLPWTLQTPQGQPKLPEKPQIWEGKGCLCKNDVSQSPPHLHCCKNICVFKRLHNKARTCMACHSLFHPAQHQLQDWLPGAAGELWVLEELSCCFYFPSEIPRWQGKRMEARPLWQATCVIVRPSIVG